MGGWGGGRVKRSAQTDVEWWARAAKAVRRPPSPSPLAPFLPCLCCQSHPQSADRNADSKGGGGGGGAEVEGSVD